MPSLLPANQARPVEQHLSKALQEFCSSSHDLGCVLSPTRRIMWHNGAWEPMLGVLSSMLFGGDFTEHFAIEDREACNAALRRASAGAGPQTFQNRCRGADGRTRWLEWVAIWIPDSRCIVAMSHDITGCKETEKSLASGLAEVELTNRELSFQKFALDQHAIVATTDRRGRITMVNDKFCEISGYSREELIGQDHRIVNSGYHDRAFFKHLYQTISGGRVWRGEIRNRAKDGHFYWVDTTIVPFMDKEGRIDRYIAIRADITDRKQSEEAIVDAHEQLTRQNRKLTELTEKAHRFVDDVSHEFRTPLAIIKEFASIIHDGLAGPVSEDQAKHLRTIDNAVIDLNQMVEDFLDSSKLKAGVLRVERRPQTVAGMFAALRPGLRRKAEARGIEILEEINPGVPEVFADEEKVRRIIMNLATNAIKFSPDNARVHLWARQDFDGGVEIGVTDHGRGLSPSDLSQLFDRFRQIPSNDAPTVKGFGLGLNIARQLVWLNLGKISAKSVAGEGATFSFTLPSTDPKLILGRFMDRLAECEPRCAALSLLAAKSTDTGEPAGSFARFLAATTRPTDLILESSTGSCLMLILGPTEEPQAWADRLIAARKAASDRPGASIDVSIVGTWPFPSSRAEATRQVLRLLTGGGK